MWLECGAFTNCIVASENLHIALSSSQVESFYEALRRNKGKVIAALCVIDLEKADAYLSEDKAEIFEVVRSTEGGFHGYNTKVVGLLRGWIADSIRALDVESSLVTDLSVEKLFD